MAGRGGMWTQEMQAQKADIHPVVAYYTFQKSEVGGGPWGQADPSNVVPFCLPHRMPGPSPPPGRNNTTVDKWSRVWNLKLKCSLCNIAWLSPPVSWAQRVLPFPLSILHLALRMPCTFLRPAFPGPKLQDIGAFS